MHPAKSVIFFTTASGAGYGLIVWLAVCALFQLTPADASFGFLAFGLAFALIVSGLMSSTLHLGHPERAWRALSQWRSSWLSREGVAAIVAFGPMGLFAINWIYGDEAFGPFAGILALASIVMALVTVYFTSMIYASLKAIPAWRHQLTSPGYLLLSLATGAVLISVLAALWGYEATKQLSLFAALFLLAGLILKVAYWRGVKSAPATSTSGTATGLGDFGKVNLVDSPHTEANYLLEEMGFKVARKHAEKLRRIAIIAGFAVPIALVLLATIADGAVRNLLLVAAVAACSAGIAVERWLFFAEAKHVVTLYYGEHEV